MKYGKPFLLLLIACLFPVVTTAQSLQQDDQAQATNVPEAPPGNSHEFYFTRGIYSGEFDDYDEGGRWAIDFPKADHQFLVAFETTQCRRCLRIGQCDRIDRSWAAAVSTALRRRSRFDVAERGGSAGVAKLPVGRRFPGDRRLLGQLGLGSVPDANATGFPPIVRSSRCRRNIPCFMCFTTSIASYRYPTFARAGKHNMADLPTSMTASYPTCVASSTTTAA